MTTAAFRTQKIQKKPSNGWESENNSNTPDQPYRRRFGSNTIDDKDKGQFFHFGMEDVSAERFTTPTETKKNNLRPLPTGNNASSKVGQLGRQHSTGVVYGGALDSPSPT